MIIMAITRKIEQVVKMTTLGIEKIWVTRPSNKGILKCQFLIQLSSHIH